MLPFLSALTFMGLCSAAGVLHPAALDFADLAEGRAHRAFSRALRSEGLLQVTGIPGFPELREEALRAAHACIQKSPNAQQHKFADGTLRRTLAAASGVTFGEQPIDHGTAAEVCSALDAAGRALREVVGRAADVFVRQLDATLGFRGKTRVFPRVDGGSYHSVTEAVQAGERLEHFHSYQVPPSDSASEDRTVDFHVDQGLFIAFVPALMVDDAAHPQASAATGAFVVETSSGGEMKVALRLDALVFLLGDGADQVINKAHGGVPLRAPSHAFRMPRSAHGLHRVWYGMMQLPPADAANEEVGLSFGEIRRQMVQAASSGTLGSEPPLALGCSRKLHARELSGGCAANQIYCWHRCVNHTDEVSPEACAAQNSGFQCVNQFDQIYVSGHGDFVPRCTNATETVSRRVMVEQPCGSCDEFMDHVNNPAYPNRVALANRTWFLWKDEENGEIKGKMLHKGLVGWMAMGIANPEDRIHNGMNGAWIVMGRNIPDQAPTLKEYRIHPFASAFRHWKDPVTPSSLQDEAMTVSGCASSIEFRTSTISGMPFNTTSGLIWGFTHLDYPTDGYGGYSGYHSATDGDPTLRSEFRGHFNLSSYVGGSFEEHVPSNCQGSPPPDGGDGGSDGDVGSDSGVVGAWSASLLPAAAWVLAALWA